MNPSGRNAIVTGGASGIGKSLVHRLLAEDATVGVFDIKKAHGQAHYWKCNIANSWEVAACVNEFREKFGPIDILVNNAGIVRNSPLLNLWKAGESDVVIWNDVIATNLSGAFYMTLNVADRMARDRTRGVIVNVSSVAASGNAGQGAYSAAKAGIEAATMAWAKELSAFHIRVAGIAPGFTDTQTTRDSLSDGKLEDWLKKTPCRRLAEPSEIVDGIMFIIRNDFFNGKILRLDGGLVI